MVDQEEEIIEDFYGVYMLYCTNPQYLGRTYIGFTVNPNRRVNQHNKGSQFGGARRTSNKGPWEMVLIIHGFPNDVAALRFEWAWQHPHRSRRLNHVAKTKTTKRSIDFCLRIVAEMLNVGPWDRLALTVRWLKPDYQRDFPTSIPRHMTVVRGPLVTKKLPSSEEAALASQQWRCALCRQELPASLAMHCLGEDCPLHAHATCLATHFLRFSDSSHVIPVTGECPKCARQCLWGELVRKKKGCTVRN